jgi:hypothetical protein
VEFGTNRTGHHAFHSAWSYNLDLWTYDKYDAWDECIIKEWNEYVQSIVLFNIFVLYIIRI